VGVGEVQKGACGKADPEKSGQNAFAPVLGGGRFTQPGADGGERQTHHRMMLRVTKWCGE
jgi:hypothetical protein